MEEALDHVWLAGPSSQTSESQRQKLGGDSMWFIESFDEDGCPAQVEGPDYQWTRPTTVSGTRGESEESFSQPMGHLRIEAQSAWRGDFAATPRDGRYFDDEEIGESYKAVLRGALDASPPSPPLTEDKSLDPNQLEARTDQRLTPHPDCETPISAAALKRKVASFESLTGDSHAMFSSGSLSSAPESEGTSGPRIESRLRAAQSTGDPLVLTVRLILDSWWTDGDANTQAAVPVTVDEHDAVRRSTRASTGLRKSMRLS